MPRVDRADSQDDAALVAMVVRGDDLALGVLHDRYSGAVYRLAASILRGTEAAEDVVQETFLVLWRHGDRYSPERASVATWLLTIARNRAIDGLRAQLGQAGRLQAAGEATLVAPPIPSPLAQILTRDEGIQLRAALAGLPSAQRFAVLLAFWGGLTHEQVAMRTGVPLGTVKSRIRLGQAKIARSLGPTPQVEAAISARSAGYPRDRCRTC